MNKSKLKQIIEASKEGNPTLVGKLTTDVLHEKIKKLIDVKKKNIKLGE